MEFSILYIYNIASYPKLEARNARDLDEVSSGLARMVHGIINTAGLLQSYREAHSMNTTDLSRASLTLQETQSIHDSMNITKNRIHGNRIQTSDYPD